MIVEVVALVPLASTITTVEAASDRLPERWSASNVHCGLRREAHTGVPAERLATRTADARYLVNDVAYEGRPSQSS